MPVTVLRPLLPYNFRMEEVHVGHPRPQAHGAVRLLRAVEVTLTAGAVALVASCLRGRRDNPRCGRSQEQECSDHRDGLGRPRVHQLPGPTARVRGVHEEERRARLPGPDRLWERSRYPRLQLRPRSRLRRRSARRSCPAVAPPSPARRRTPPHRRWSQMLKVSQCMRRHGISEFPDPSSVLPSNNGRHSRGHRHARSDPGVPVHARHVVSGIRAGGGRVQFRDGAARAGLGARPARASSTASSWRSVDRPRPRRGRCPGWVGRR